MNTIKLRQIVARARRFGTAKDGQIAMLFALMAVVLISAAGGGIDLMRAYHARQKLSEIAALTCQYASRPSVLQLLNSTTTSNPGAKSYADTVGGYIDEAVKTQLLNWTVTNSDRFTQTGTGPAKVELAVAVPTAFAKIMQITEIPVSATAQCYDSPSALPPADAFVVKEGFETRGGTNAKDQGGWQYYTINGRTIAKPSSDPGATPVYTGANNSVWYGTGYCLETDQVGTISSTLPEGRQSAELDCDDGAGSAGNSAISTKVDLAGGNYELRYFYRSRVT
ncbi:TadE/TadG family type IV pilus assembly protein [uncultured Methylobacterium sp.]|uniref:TadE/TadG family type IV pilus assembly protein n=1 Tax=uncultured Methylobacterium sp. TaxID=157278 RepID=UPI0035CB5B2E